MTTQDNIRAAVLAITPRRVHDRISTISPDMWTYPADCCQCPLYEFFVEEFPDERIDAVSFEAVEITDADGGEYVRYRLPLWMHDYQAAMIEEARYEMPMARAVEILERYL